MIIVLILLSIEAKSQDNENRREQWLNYMDKISRPVISNLASDMLKEKMTITLSNTSDNPEQRKEGWLNIGLHGNQPDLADVYINTGSLYLCTTIFLPLGLSPADPFWTDPDAPWTSKKIWDGMNVPADQSFRGQ